MTPLVFSVSTLFFCGEGGRREYIPWNDILSFNREVAMRIAVYNLLCVLLVLIGFCATAAGEAFVGIVKSIEGDVVIKRNGEILAVTQGMEIMPVDIIKTDRQGSVGLVFSDDTRITMGPKTEISVDEYLFEPKDRNLSFVVRLIKGTVSFLSGQIAKLSPDSVQLVMPAGTIGVRGTHVLIKVD